MNNETRKKSTEFKVWGAMNIVIEKEIDIGVILDMEYFTESSLNNLENLLIMAAHTANAEIIKMIENNAGYPLPVS